MKDTAVFRRTAVSLCLVASALSTIVAILLEPAFPADQADRLRELDEAGAGAAISAALFPVSQVFMLGALLGIAHLVRAGAPVLSNLGGSLAVLGTLGHASFSGAALMTVTMAEDVDNRQVHAALLEDFESSPFMAFAAVGLLGSVLGLLVLSAALLRSGAVARWIPLLMILFVVLEFVGSSVSDYAGYLGASALLLAFGALAIHVWQTPNVDWDVASTRRPVATTSVAA